MASDFMAIEDLLARKLDEKLRPMKSSLKDLSSQLAEAVNSLAFLHDQCDMLTKKVKFLESRNTSLETENKLIKVELNKMAGDLNTTKKSLVDIEQCSRRDCFEIKGVPVTPTENTNDVLKNVGDLMEVEILEEDISTSHRLQAPRPNPNQRPAKPVVHVNTPTASIIVKFARRDVRDRFYAGRKHLRDKSVRDIGLTRSEQDLHFGKFESRQQGAVQGGVKRQA
ncbi:predicted protein [Nematostella vectensis]|uniref:Uncharacterized protein n=1 Tax=Nematostella vectensis TaxID=45351 RepID=A7SMC1_NEMVE|nr:predicted protein [Nematostella vectensis]|eukprot:XP_001627241.1 predicted protein [Nematostella vectensis]